MCPKDESEINTIKKACQATVAVFDKYLKEQIMEIVDADKVSPKFQYTSDDLWMFTFG